MTPELQSKVAMWRARAEAGTLTEADMIEAIRELRAGRYGAQTASDSAKRKRSIAAVPDADTLLKDLLGEEGL